MEPLDCAKVDVLTVYPVVSATAIGTRASLAIVVVLDTISRHRPGWVERRIGRLEATPRIELGMEVLQTSALPLGYVAPGPEAILRLGYGIT